MIRARAETFGAWVRVDDRTLLAVDRSMAARFGVEGGDRWSLPPPPSLADQTDRPLEVHVAVTAKCPAACSGCYLDARADGAHRSFDDICAALDRVAAGGAFTVAFGGGEPMLHPELPAIAAHARRVGLTPVVTTSGIGLNAERARALRDFAQVNVSHDGVEVYEEVRGYDGARVADRAIAMLVEAGVPDGVNVVLTRALLGDDGRGLIELVEHVRALGAREVQLLRYKPAGRAASLEYLMRRLTQAQVALLPSLVRAIVPRISVRIDCAMVPFLAFERVDELLALGVMGCEAGRALSAVDTHGRTSPCSFLPGRATPSPPLAEPCASCPVRAVCRGGCRVVAEHLGDPSAPDPECPRVRA
jgi:MoaA/NifB/PqqE/SkfB family radical SAM enzyme